MNKNNSFKENNLPNDKMVGNDFSEYVDKPYQEAISFGFSPIPLNGKRPFLKNWQTLEKRLILDSLEKHEGNVGIRTGKHSGIIIIDCDVPRMGKEETDGNGNEQWEEIVKKETGLDDPSDLETWVDISGSGGYRYYFRYEDDKEYNGKISKCNIDILANGKQAVYAGSLYPGCGTPHKCGATNDDECLFAGRKYEWLNSPQDYNLKDIPEWLEKYIFKKLKTKTKTKQTKKINKKDETDDDSHSQEHSQEEEEIHIKYEYNMEKVQQILERLNVSRFTDYADWRDFIWMTMNMGVPVELIHQYSAKADNYDMEATDKMISEFVPEKCHMGIRKLLKWLKEDLIEKYILELGQEKGKELAIKEYSQVASMFIFNKDAYDLLRGDLGMADVYYRHFAKDNIVTVDGKGNGYMWNKNKRLWEAKHPIFLQNVISKILEPIVRIEVKRAKQELERAAARGEASLTLKAYASSWQQKLHEVCMSKTLKGIFNLSLSLTDNPEFEEIKNTDNELLPIKDGKVINLRTLTVSQRERWHNFTLELPVAYTPKANNYENCLKFFKGIACGDMEFVDYLQRLLGYTFTRETRDRSLYILWGEGLNGKSTVINILKTILQQFYVTCSESVLIKQERSGGATPELMPLQTARLAVVAETEEQQTLNGPRVKKLTGNDSVCARDLYKSTVNFVPKCKLFMMTNKKPLFDTTDQAMIDRLKFIPFLARFEKNQGYEDKLNGEYLDEIFSWLAEGAQKTLRGEKLVPCKMMKTAMNEYLNELDVVAQFIDEYLVKGPADDKNYRIKKTEMYPAYVEWCRTNRIEQDNKAKFNKKMGNHLEERRFNTSGRYWVGVKFNSYC